MAATANNSECGVGIAYGAGIGGVRMLDGDVTDAIEARSLTLNNQHIDIFSARYDISLSMQDVLINRVALYHQIRSYFFDTILQCNLAL